MVTGCNFTGEMFDYVQKMKKNSREREINFRERKLYVYVYVLSETEFGFMRLYFLGETCL